MTEDVLLFALGRAASQEQAEQYRRFDERWDRLCAGELPAEEERRLCQLAASSAEHRLALEAFRPLEPEHRSRLVQLLSGLGAPLHPVAAASPAQQHAPSPARRSERYPCLVSQEPGSAAVGTGIESRHSPEHRERGDGTGQPATSRCARRPWWSQLSTAIRSTWAVPVAAILVLAALLLPLLSSSQQPLPGYTVELRGSIRELRSGDAVTPVEQPVLSNGSRLALVLRPESAVSGELVVRCFLAQGRSVWEHPLPLQVAASGSVRIEAEIGRDLSLDPGPWQLITVVARKGYLPDEVRLRRLLPEQAAMRADHWVILRTSFVVGQAGGST